MTVVGLLNGLVGTDVLSGVTRFTGLSDRVELVALATRLFSVADFLRHANRMNVINKIGQVRLRDMGPCKAELRQSFLPMVRGTVIGILFGAMPGTSPTIITFIAYAFERNDLLHVRIIPVQG